MGKPFRPFQSSNAGSDMQRQPRQLTAAAASATAVSGATAERVTAAAPTSLVHALGAVGEVSPTHMPWLLRLAYIKAQAAGQAADASAAAVQVRLRSVAPWRVGGCRSQHGCATHAQRKQGMRCMVLAQLAWCPVTMFPRTACAAKADVQVRPVCNTHGFAKSSGQCCAELGTMRCTPCPSQISSIGLTAWRASLERGLLPDDATLEQLVSEGDDFARAAAAASPGDPSPLLQWPEEPLRTMLLRALGKLGVSRCVLLRARLRAAAQLALGAVGEQLAGCLSGQGCAANDSRVGLQDLGLAACWWACAP